MHRDFVEIRDGGETLTLGRIGTLPPQPRERRAHSGAHRLLRRTVAEPRVQCELREFLALHSLLPFGYVLNNYEVLRIVYAALANGALEAGVVLELPQYRSVGDPLPPVRAPPSPPPPPAVKYQPRPEPTPAIPAPPNNTPPRGASRDASTGAGAADPCGKDAISNVTKCCGSEAFDAAKAANGGKEPKLQYGTPSSGFDAETDTSTGTITISDKSDKCTATESVYFELTNLASKPAFDKVQADAAAGKLSREDYARGNEKIEYENVVKANAAIDKCKKKWGCDSHTFSFDGFRPATDFDDYYSHYLAESHKNHYRNAWDRNYKRAYDAAHPHSH